MADKNEREKRKRYDYPNVLAKIFNDLTALQEIVIQRQKVFSDALLEINNLSRQDKLSKDEVERVTMAAINIITGKQ